MAKRTDANQQEITNALLGVGATVESLHKVGGGCVDLLVGFGGVNYLLELKTERGRLNKRQQEWHEEWRGRTFVVRSVDQALAAIGVEVQGTYAVAEEAHS